MVGLDDFLRAQRERNVFQQQPSSVSFSLDSICRLLSKADPSISQLDCNIYQVYGSVHATHTAVVRSPETISQKVLHATLDSSSFLLLPTEEEELYFGGSPQIAGFL